MMPFLKCKLLVVGVLFLLFSSCYELSLYCKGDEKEWYISQADDILRSLSSKEYRAGLGENNYFLLKHITGHYPNNSEVDVPIIYANYYFLEANLRRLKLLANWQGEKVAVIIKADDLVTVRELQCLYNGRSLQK